MTILVEQLEQLGLVQRERRSDDGRVVLVDPTESGRAALESYREQIHAALGAYLAEISDQQVDALVAATETLSQFVTVLQERSIH
jgi:DNA-binding MarR family transcriptional regulator